MRRKKMKESSSDNWDLQAVLKIFSFKRQPLKPFQGSFQAHNHYIDVIAKQQNCYDENKNSRIANDLMMMEKYLVPLETVSKGKH